MSDFQILKIGKMREGGVEEGAHPLRGEEGKRVVGGGNREREEGAL